MHKKDMEIERLKVALANNEKEESAPVPAITACSSTSTVASTSAMTRASTSFNHEDFDPLPTELEADCEKRYGLALVDEWRQNGQVWCKPNAGAGMKSEIKCYPQHQVHKVRTLFLMILEFYSNYFNELCVQRLETGP